MNKDALQNLIDGYSLFRSEYLGKENEAYRRQAVEGQQPRVMMIACSDSRITPAILTQSRLGEVFMVNNVANLVPPYKEGHNTHHSTSSALEFALLNLPIEHIIILGHSGCGGIQALMNDNSDETDQTSYSFIKKWISIASPAKMRVLEKCPHGSSEQQNTLCEHEALLVSLENLIGFPWVKSAIAESRLLIHAWYFDIASGTIEQYLQDQDIFVPLLRTPQAQDME